MSLFHSLNFSLSISLWVHRIINKGKLCLVNPTQKSSLAVCSRCFTSYSHLPGFITMLLYCPWCDSFCFCSHCFCSSPHTKEMSTHMTQYCSERWLRSDGLHIHTSKRTFWFHIYVSPAHQNHLWDVSKCFWQGVMGISQRNMTRRRNLSNFTTQTHTCDI